MRLKKIRWHCLRGTKELDRLLNHYLDHEFEHSDVLDQEAFIKLLDCQDSDLQDYLLKGFTPNDSTLSNIVLKVREVWRVITSTSDIA